MIEPKLIKTKSISLKGIIFFVIGVAVIFILIAWIPSCTKEDDTPPPPEKVLVLVDSKQYTLTPGQKIVFSTTDPETGELCNYIPVWEKYTQDSMLHHTVHGQFGKDGVGSKIHGHYIHPSRGGTFHGGDEMPTNDDVYFVMVRNDCEDTVTFTVELYGWRLP